MLISRVYVHSICDDGFIDLNIIFKQEKSLAIETLRAVNENLIKLIFILLLSKNINDFKVI